MDLLCNGPGWNKGLDCEGMFADGGTTEAFVQTAFNLPKTYPENCVFGWSCETTAPEGWQFYKNGTDTPVQKQVDPTGYRWTSMVKADGTGGRNHHFCYETHAKFTYKPGLRLALRGSDDIWAFIDNKLAIDLGGVHLDAPGYVSLDAFKGASGTLVDGNMYDVDIFACDRRTTMSNLQIRTNMFMQSLNDVAIQIKSAKNAEKPAESDYSICYTKMTGTCGISGEPETICIDTSTIHHFTQISYTLVNGVSLTDSIVEGFKDLSTPGVYHGGIDLTNIASPVVDKSKINLPEGRYTLFVNIDGKSAKVMTFRIGTDVIKPVARIAGASFTVKNSLPQALTITVTNSAAKYAVMDLQGRVVRQGMLAGAETVVPNLNPGSYIVKVARETRRVNVR
jgi:fibro-slime domain-containing protein